ncbi:UDP-glycosyltransferase 74F2-like [Corylus avellana]|uniref:UDP-glycosyltransferase 74F2-like n=1 Tax=Corylus avellana TaxID=13451 RepID=UPI00286B484A|nr:UDP-glycosyltransferase 74F2-like [Corylus avellana]XP_059450753.1 UDP-glycosyltransferase 74F2-like [Corylus avellana]
MEGKAHGAHVLALPYPTQGHINPMLQFSKRLASKGVKATLATTVFIYNSMQPPSSESVQFDTISDGHDEGGFAQAESIPSYLARMEAIGSKTLADIIIKNKDTAHPVDCIIYDPFLPWALEVAKKFGLVGAAFFTQTCAVNLIYYYVHHGLLKLPISSTPISIPGLPPLELQDMPSFVSVSGSYPAYFEMVLNQFSNTDKADWVLVNTFYKLEVEVVDSMSKVCPLLTIGPTIPSIYLDNRVENDNDYGLNLFTIDDLSVCTDWLNTKPAGSVVYVSFGSLAHLSNKQMEELAFGLKGSNFYFLWVVKASEGEKLPENFVEEMGHKGLVVKWSPQVEVLSSKGVGCFFTHGGWNSTLEALCLGVPMVVMPQWTDQPTNAKFVEDVWKVGVRVEVDENGVVGREEIESCIRKVMEGERGKEMKENAKKWSNLAIEAVSEDGTSDKNIEEFVSKLIKASPMV